MDIDQAVAWLDGHINLEADSSRHAAAMRLDRIRHLLELMGDPQSGYPVIHLTGTNGKGSTARMISALLSAMGLSIGTYTSPHLERLNERLAWGGEPISDAALAELIDLVSIIEPAAASRPSYFEILTAAAFRWFADVAVDAAVVEVGLGGRWDATNVADGTVAVVTNIALDHTEVIGPTLIDIAREKAGIVKPGSTLVLGATDPEVAAVFRDAGASTTWTRDEDFGCVVNKLAHGGRLVDIRTPGAEYSDIYLPVHGAHQGDNAAAALAAVEAFFGAPLGSDVVADAFAGLSVPGRMEVMGHRPLMLIDGAHNPAGATALSESLAEEFPVRSGRILVVGMLAGRDPTEMLSALDVTRARLVIACAPNSPRAQPPVVIAAAAESLGTPALIGGSVPEALARALELAEPEEQIVISGSLYVVGEARTELRGLLG